MNTMKRACRGLPMLLLALALASPAAGRDHEEAFDFEPGKTLVFELEDGGSVEIKGWDEHRVQIAWYDHGGDVERHDISFRESDDGLEVHSEWKSRRHDSHGLSFEIRAPHEIDVRIDTAGGGLTFEDLQGRFRGKTAGGGLVLLNCKGVARLTSGGGHIRIEDCELDGKVTIGGGPALVKNVIGDLRVSSGGGNVQYVNVRTRDGELRGPERVFHDRGFRDADIGEETVLITTAGGGIDVDEAPAGAIVSTGGGNIDIEEAARFVCARTGGGDIEIRIESGPVEATTGAGDIEVEIREDAGDIDADVILLTGYGEITLIVPRGFSMDLDLTIGYTRNSRQDFEYITDLDIDEERTSEWDTSHGSPMKYIYGTGRFAGGKHKVRIRATNGDIRIRER
jgi:DUF4097 and DUF4098 domain-containing protein YvlB